MCEPLGPVGAELGSHPALDERPAHGRRLALQLGKFCRVFLRQGFGNGRQQLGDLHDRPLQPAQGGCQFGRALGLVVLEAEQPVGHHARRDPADIAADLRIAAQARRQPVRLVVAVSHDRALPELKNSKTGASRLRPALARDRE